jgi:lipopolysaccharide/colanic/teichoic acid biosynthesis glycosyltransferase
MDVEYANHRSLVLDLKILAATAVSVLRRDGITAESEATMRELFGPEEVGSSQ